MEKSSPKTTPSLVFKTPDLTQPSTERGERRRCCFLELNLDLTIQTKHLQLLTVETEKQWNLDNSYVFKARHTQKQVSLYEGGRVRNSED